MYPTSSGDVPVLGTFLLSPIKELDTGSLNSTLHANSPSTVQLAKTLQSSSPTLSRIITVNSGPAPTDNSTMASSQMPVVSMVLPTSYTSAAISSHLPIPVTLPADTTISMVPTDDPLTGSIPSRRRFEVTLKDNLKKSTSLDSGSAVESLSTSSSRDADDKRKSDGNVHDKIETGEVYV